jgi:predicted nuclease with RNAse H fold
MEPYDQVAPLYRKLESKGYSVVPSHPKNTKHTSEARIKSDPVDPWAIAELARLEVLARAIGLHHLAACLAH